MAEINDTGKVIGDAFREYKRNSVPRNVDWKGDSTYVPEVGLTNESDLKKAEAKSRLIQRDYLAGNLRQEIQTATSLGQLEGINGGLLAGYCQAQDESNEETRVGKQAAKLEKAFRAELVRIYGKKNLEEADSEWREKRTELQAEEARQFREDVGDVRDSDDMQETPDILTPGEEKELEEQARWKEESDRNFKKWLQDKHFLQEETEAEAPTVVEKVMETGKPEAETKVELIPAGDDLGPVPGKTESEKDEGRVLEETGSNEDEGPVPGIEDENKTEDKGGVPEKKTEESEATIEPETPRLMEVEAIEPGYELEMTEDGILEVGYFANYQDLSTKKGELVGEEKINLAYLENVVNAKVDRFKGWVEANDSGEIVLKTYSWLINERNNRQLKPGEQYTYDVLKKLLDQDLKSYYQQGESTAPQATVNAEPVKTGETVQPAAPEALKVETATTEESVKKGSKTENLIGLPHAAQFAEFMTLAKTPQKENSDGAAKLRELGQIVQQNFDEYMRWQEIEKEAREGSDQ